MIYVFSKVNGEIQCHRYYVEKLGHTLGWPSFRQCKRDSYTLNKPAAIDFMERLEFAARYLKQKHRHYENMDIREIKMDIMRKPATATAHKKNINEFIKKHRRERSCALVDNNPDYFRQIQEYSAKIDRKIENPISNCVPIPVLSACVVHKETQLSQLSLLDKQKLNEERNKLFGLCYEHPDTPDLQALLDQAWGLETKDKLTATEIALLRRALDNFHVKKAARRYGGFPTLKNVTLLVPFDPANKTDEVIKKELEDTFEINQDKSYVKWTIEDKTLTGTMRYTAAERDVKFVNLSQLNVALKRRKEAEEAAEKALHTALSQHTNDNYSITHEGNWFNPNNPKRLKITFNEQQFCRCVDARLDQKQQQDLLMRLNKAPSTNLAFLRSHLTSNLPHSTDNKSTGPSASVTPPQRSKISEQTITELIKLYEDDTLVTQHEMIEMIVNTFSQPNLTLDSTMTTKEIENLKTSWLESIEESFRRFQEAALANQVASEAICNALTFYEAETLVNTVIENALSSERTSNP